MDPKEIDASEAKRVERQQSTRRGKVMQAMLLHFQKLPVTIRADMADLFKEFADALIQEARARALWEIATGATRAVERTPERATLARPVYSLDDWLDT